MPTLVFAANPAPGAVSRTWELQLFKRHGARGVAGRFQLNCESVREQGHAPGVWLKKRGPQPQLRVWPAFPCARQVFDEPPIEQPAFPPIRNPAAIGPDAGAILTSNRKHLEHRCFFFCRTWTSDSRIPSNWYSPSRLSPGSVTQGETWIRPAWAYQQIRFPPSLRPGKDGTHTKDHRSFWRP